MGDNGSDFGVSGRQGGEGDNGSDFGLNGRQWETMGVISVSMASNRESMGAIRESIGVI